MHIHYLDALDLPELEPYRTLRRRKDMERRNLFVAEDEKCVRRLLDSPFDYELVSMLATPEWLRKLRCELDVRPEAIQAYITDRGTIGDIAGHTSHHGLKMTARIVKPHTIDSVLANSSRPRLIVACDGLANAENMGVIIRNTAAFGGNAILVGETAFSPYLTRSIRTSMGTIFSLPCVHSENLVDTLKDLKWQGFRIMAAHAHADQKTVAGVNFNQDVCFVFGSEGNGISAKVEKVCDDLVIIPMTGTVDSLNVGSAAAVFLYEAARQRGTMEQQRIQRCLSHQELL